MVGGFVLDLRLLYRTLGLRVRLLVERIRVTLPSLIVGVGVRIVLWLGVETV